MRSSLTLTAAALLSSTSRIPDETVEDNKQVRSLQTELVERVGTTPPGRYPYSLGFKTVNKDPNSVRLEVPWAVTSGSPQFGGWGASDVAGDFAPMQGFKNVSPHRVTDRRKKNKAARKAKRRNRKP